MKVQVVSAWTGEPSLDVLEDRGCVVFETRKEAEDYLAERDFDASIAIIPVGGLLGDLHD